MKFHIETPRLLLREMRPTDAEGMFDLDSREEVAKYLGTPPLTDIEQSRKIIEYVQSQYKDFGIGRWAVEWRETGEFVGWAGLKFLTEPMNGHTDYYDVGYRLLPKFWGRGVATEAARASLDFGFGKLNLQKIYGVAMVENGASCAVLQKVGLRAVNDFEEDGLLLRWFEMERPS